MRNWKSGMMEEAPDLSCLRTGRFVLLPPWDCDIFTIANGADDELTG